MKIKKKTLALMVGIACGGLIYGITANATGVDGFNTSAEASLTTIKNALTSDETELDKPNLSLPTPLSDMKNSLNGGSAKIVNAGDAPGYDAKETKVIDDNSKFVKAFGDVLSSDKANRAENGLVAKLYDLLKGDSNGFKNITINQQGKAEASADAASSSEVVSSLLNLIQLAQQAQAADKARNDGKEMAYSAFLAEAAVKGNLKLLGITDDAGVLKPTVDAAKTFGELVELSSGTPSVISLSEAKNNMAFMKQTVRFLTVNASQTGLIESFTQGSEQTGAATRVSSSDKLLVGLKYAVKFDEALKDNDSNSVIVAKGTVLGVEKGITFGGKEVSGSKPFVFANDKVQALGALAVKDSNVQGSGNTLLARSEVVVDRDSVYNLAEGMTVLGNDNTIESKGIAVGNKNTVSEKGIVVGNNSQATAPNAIAFGNDAVAAHANSVALGSNSRTTQENEINVGMWTLSDANDVSKGYTQTARIITGVAEGTTIDSAVNYKQLTDLKADSEAHANEVAHTEAQAALEDSKIYTNGEIATANKANKSYTDNKVATIGTVANTYTDKKVNGLRQEMNSKIDALDKKVNKGFAANAALSGLFQPYGVGKINLTAGVGGYQSESAVAVGVGYRVNENVAVKGGVATAVGNGSSTMYNASVNFEW